MFTKSVPYCIFTKCVTCVIFTFSWPKNRELSKNNTTQTQDMEQKMEMASEKIYTIYYNYAIRIIIANKGFLGSILIKATRTGWSHGYQDQIKSHGSILQSFLFAFMDERLKWLDKKFFDNHTWRDVNPI